MKHGPFIPFLLAAIALSFVSCAPKAAAGHATIQSIGNPGGKGSSAREGQRPASRPSVPRVALDGGEELLGLIDLNVDNDQGDEQIAAFRRQGDPTGAIQLAIIDQDPLRETWERVWTGSTLVSSWPTFSVSVRDLLGGFGTDLVCVGMNGAGRQTMTVFHLDKGTPPAGFRQILSIEGDSIEIREDDRGEAYASGVAPAAPLAILSFDRNASSADFLDQIQTLWTWKASSSSYERAESGPVSKGRIERKAIEQYLGKGVDVLEKFLDGTWYMAGPGGSSSRLVQFDQRGRSIAFSEPGNTRSLTSYDWAGSQPTSLGLFIVANNAAVDRVRLFIEVELTGSDSLALRTRENMEQLKVESDSSWNGSYRRMTMEDGPSAPTASPPPLPSLEGSWVGPGGLSLVFTDKRFSWKDDKRTEEGVYSRYAVGRNGVLILRTLSASGLILGSRTFRIDAAPGDAGGSKGSIVLRAAILTVEGVELADGSAIPLERR